MPASESSRKLDWLTESAHLVLWLLIDLGSGVLGRRSGARGVGGSIVLQLSWSLVDWQVCRKLLIRLVQAEVPKQPTNTS